MYQRKVMEERNEAVRDMMLERFAQEIWKVEGSGKCSHRMRCILNEPSIRRLWPEYESFVDNSWKLMGIGRLLTFLFLLYVTFLCMLYIHISFCFGQLCTLVYQVMFYRPGPSD